VIDALRGDPDVMRLVGAINEHVLPLQHMHDDAIEAHNRDAAELGAPLITPRGGEVGASPRLTPAQALGGMGTLAAPEATSLAMGQPQPEAAPWPAYGKVPFSAGSWQMDPRWGGAALEAAGFLDTPAKLGMAAFGGLRSAMTAAKKAAPHFGLIPGTQVFKAGEPKLTYFGGPVKSFEPPADWNAVAGQDWGLNEPPINNPNKKPLASGLVMIEPNGQVWLTRPKGGGVSGGTQHTFPKGRIEPGLDPQANAIKEAYEETGLQGDILAHLGDYESPNSVTRYYLARRGQGVPQDHGPESEAVLLAHPEDLPKLLNRQRDRDVMADALAHPQHPWKLPKTEPTDRPHPEVVRDFEANGPPDIDHWQQTGPQGGSNKGGEYTSTEGQKWYVKFPKTEDHVWNERLTNELYRLTGADVPQTMVIRRNGQLGIASHMLPEGSKIMNDVPLGVQQSTMFPALHEHFASDAWLSNRDVIGGFASPKDNTMLTPDGRTVRIDPGGGLRYRGMGQPKTDFGPEVTEWDYMQNKGHVKEVYGNIPPQKQIDSINKVLSVTPEQLSDAIQRYGPRDTAEAKKLYDTLLDRQQDLKLIRDKVQETVLPKTPSEPAPGAEAKAYGEKQLPDTHTAPAAPAPVTYKTSNFHGDKIAVVGNQAVAEIKALGPHHTTNPNQFMVTPLYGDNPTYHDTMDQAKAHIEASPSWAKSPFADTGLTAPLVDMGPGQTPAVAPRPPPQARGPADIAAAKGKGNSPQDPLSFNEVKALYNHHSGDKPYQRGEYKVEHPKGDKILAKRDQPVIMDPSEEIPAHANALQQMLTNWLMTPGAHAAAREASPYTVTAFRGVSGMRAGPPREFPTPGKYQNAYFSVSDPEVAAQYALHTGLPEAQWVPPDPAIRARIQHLRIDTRNYLHVDAEGREWTEINDAAAAEAARRGKHGVVINNVFDNAAGYAKPGQAPHTTYLTFKPGMHTVRRYQARFDPEHFGKVGLNLGVAGVLPVGIAAAYSHLSPPSNALGAQ
jgi:8-oxo-dGTP pyrophosphatase MutT (NUDIX family)